MGGKSLQKMFTPYTSFPDLFGESREHIRLNIKNLDTPVKPEYDSHP
jgi:hypothetical protein